MCCGLLQRAILGPLLVIGYISGMFHITKEPNFIARDGNIDISGTVF